MRVHELARELGVASKDILAALDEMELQGRVALSSVPEQVVARLRRSVWLTTRPTEGDGEVGGSGRPTIPFRRTAAEVVEMLRVQLQRRSRVPGPPSPGPLARWRARRAVREEAHAASGPVRPPWPSAIGRWRARRRIRLEAGRGRPPRPSPLARAWARRSVLVTPRPPGPGLRQRLAMRRAGVAAAAATVGVAAPAARTGRPPLRSRQDLVMAGAALLLIAGAFSTFAVLRSDPSPVSRVLPPASSPSLELEAPPTGEDLAAPGALAAPEPSPSPRPRLGLARGAGIAAAGEVPSPSPSSAAAVPPSPAGDPPPTVKPSPPAPPTTKPPGPSPSPSPSPSPTPTESPSPSPSDDDD